MLKRKKIVNEIHHTEKHYVKVLEILNDLFYTPLKNKQNGIVTLEETKVIFSGVEGLKICNLSLLEQISNRVSEWNKNNQLGDIFLSLAPYFKMYITYISTYQQRIDKLNEILKREEVRNWFNVNIFLFNFIFINFIFILFLFYFYFIFILFLFNFKF